MNTTTVLSCQDLRKYYTVSNGWLRKPSTVKALDGISFDLAAGKTLAIVGESGCGKSTLAKQLTLIESASAGVLKIKGNDVSRLSPQQVRNLRKEIQIIFQNPFASLNPRKTVSAILQEPMIINTRLTARQRQQQVHRVMQRVGLRPEHERRYPHMFSGGQRQRIAIARALILNPSIIIADEPVSALDVSIQAQIINLLKQLQQELNLAYVFISHDLNVVKHIADEVLVMYLGKTMEQAGNRLLFENASHPYTRTLLSAIPQLDQASTREHTPVLSGELPSPLNPPTGCLFHTRCPYATDICAREQPDLQNHEGLKLACHHPR